MNNIPKPYKYKQHKLAFNFTDSTGNLSPEMDNIRIIIGKIAIDNLDVQKFRDFYEIDFIMADFTEIIDPETNETIGFLFATFYKNTISSSPKFKAKAFHAVEKKYRQSERKYKRIKLHEKYIEFYSRRIFLIEFLIQSDTFLKTILKRPGISTLNNLKNLLPDTIKNLNNAKNLEIEILAENPTTYYDLCEYGIIHNTVSRDNTKDEWLQSLSVKDLIVASATLYNEYETKIKIRPVELVKTDFTVNTTTDEWCNFFKTSKVDKKFYLWQNYDCPNYAFRIKIPVDPANIINPIINMIDSEGLPLLKHLSKKLIAYIRIEAAKKNVVNKTIVNTAAKVIDSYINNLTSKDVKLSQNVKNELLKYFKQK